MSRLVIEQISKDLKDQFKTLCMRRGTTMRKEVIRFMNEEILKDSKQSRVFFRPLVNEIETIECAGIDPMECVKCGKTIKGNDYYYSLGFTAQTADESWEAHEKLYGDPSEVSFCNKCADKAADAVETESRLIKVKNTGAFSQDDQVMPKSFKKYRLARIEEIEEIRDTFITEKDEWEIEKEWEQIQQRGVKK